MEKECSVCQGSFETKSHKAKFCSNKCQQQHKRAKARVHIKATNAEKEPAPQEITQEVEQPKVMSDLRSEQKAQQHDINKTLDDNMDKILKRLWYTTMSSCDGTATATKLVIAKVMSNQPDDSKLEDEEQSKALERDRLLNGPRNNRTISNINVDTTSQDFPEDNKEYQGDN